MFSWADISLSQQLLVGQVGGWLPSLGLDDLWGLWDF